eukprot:TRINITY_DN50583_c0_g1_i1.p1 TRINITY_DN50583_c0_g1~~TRINITY_DN50583_c0_g1_i1.p1  ORF type:complete len:773 (+),score=281.72 TRINITY_DN50583_c0_g1_i1:87-2321(+)
MGQTMRRQCGCGDGRWKGQAPPQLFAAEEDEPTRTCLPQVDPLHKDRTAARNRAHDVYNAQAMKRKSARTGPPPALPSGWPINIDDPVPPQEQYGDYWCDRFNWEVRLAEVLRRHLGPAAEELMSSVEFGPGRDRWQSFAELESFFFAAPDRDGGFPRPALLQSARNWRDDAEFVRARLAGAHPSVLTQVRHTSRPLVERLPEGLQIDAIEKGIAGHLDSCDGLFDAIRQGRLYVVDHSGVLKELCAYGQRGWEWECPRGIDRKQAVLCNPVALFFRRLQLDTYELTAQDGSVGVTVTAECLVDTASEAAAAAGLKPGMRVHRVNQQHVLSRKEFDAAVRGAEKVQIEVLRALGPLEPLCIQLYCDPAHPGHAALASRNPIYYPWDPVNAWLMAKMFFNQADLHVHIIGTLHTQHVLLPALVHSITWRNLSVHHPLRQLLRPHLRGAIGWAERWHNTLLAGDAGLLLRWLAVDYERYQDVSVKSYLQYDFINNSAKHDWRQRMRAQADVPDYPFRDDSLATWDAVEEYALSVVRRYYTKYDDIDHDVELIGWIKEMSFTVGRVMELHPARPWDPIVFNLTNVILMCSAMHAAQTSQIYDWYACVPFFPANATVPPYVDKEKEDITEADLLQIMPDKQCTLLQIATCYLLSQFADPADTPGAMPPQAAQDSPPAAAATGPPRPAGLGDFGRRELFVDRSANKFAMTLQARLLELDQRIAERSASSEVPYDALAPSRVRNGLPAVP